MLPDKRVLFGVQGRRDLLIAAARVGFTHPLCSVVLPLHRTVVNLRGPAWNVDAAAAQQALATFDAFGTDWSEPPAADTMRAVVTGDDNYAHHIWNQLGALETLLSYGNALTVLATHQPIAPIAEIFADHPGLTVKPIAPEALPALDPRRVMPFPAGGKIVRRSVRDRIQAIAARRASEPVRNFIASARARGLALIWITVRVYGRTAINLFDALLALGEMLLREPHFGLVIDGYSRPNDLVGNSDYPHATLGPTVAHEQKLARTLIGELGRRAGAGVADRIFDGVGLDLLDSIHLAAQCRAYFAHHGTLQHKIGYFTTVPGMVHANPGILASDPAGAQLHVIEDPGAIEYINPALIADMVMAGGTRLGPNNAYRFKNLPALTTAFREFLARKGVP